MTQTEILAIFGSITGFSALVIHFKNYLDGLAKLEISFPNPEINNFFKVSPDEDGYNCSSRCAFYVRIENRSAKPITIVEFKMNLGSYEMYLT